MSSLGNNIGLVAPSGIFNAERLEKGIAKLEEWGYTVHRSPNLHKQHLCMAGTIEQRCIDIEWACTHPDIDFIWFARGGYGTIQLLNRLEKTINKPILGFSDATALGAMLTNQASSSFYHAPVVHSLTDLCNQETQDSLRIFLEEGTLPSFSVVPLINESKKPISGKLVGGNLCVITSAMGTPYQLQTTDSILMIEDIGEPAYKIHRMLTQIRLGGLFSECKAVVLGTFEHCKAPDTFSLYDAIRDALQGLKIPVYYNALFGHGSDNHIWNAGRTYTLDKGNLYVE